jgi:hypothetical protein
MEITPIMDIYTERLFPYGTLQQAAVQLANFRRKLKSSPDEFNGYKITSVKTNDPEMAAESWLELHKILMSSDDPMEIAEGVLFANTPEELRAADDYETDSYKCVRVKLKSCMEVSIYVRSLS